MAQSSLGAQVTTGNQFQMKEDIADIVFNVSPTKTPFQSICKKGKAQNVTVSWQMDLLVNPSVPVGIAEGASAPNATGISTGVQSNWTQIYTEVASVSGTADSVSWYGRKKEMAYQMAKKTSEMKNKLERSLCNYSNSAAGTAILTAGLFDATAGVVAAGPASPRSFKNFMHQEAFSALGDGTAGQSQDRTISSGGGVLITEAAITAAHQKIWEKGGDPSILMVDGSTSIAIAGFAMDTGVGTSGRFRDSGQGKKLVNVVDMYVSPFGELSVVINRFFPAVAAADTEHQAFFLDPQYLELCYLRGPFKQDLALTGDFMSKELVQEVTLKVLSSDSCGALANFTAA